MGQTTRRKCGEMTEHLCGVQTLGATWRFLKSCPVLKTVPMGTAGYREGSASGKPRGLSKFCVLKTERRPVWPLSAIRLTRSLVAEWTYPKESNSPWSLEMRESNSNNNGNVNNGR